MLKEKEGVRYRSKTRKILRKKYKSLTNRLNINYVVNKMFTQLIQEKQF